MPTSWDILGLGIAAVDDLIYVDRFPEPDTKLPVVQAIRQGGGLTATALVAAARLGARAAYCGLLGFDELSEFTLRGLAAAGVDCSLTPRLPAGRPAHSYIIVDRSAGTRTILCQPGAADPPPEIITPELIARCRVLCVDHLAPYAGLKAARLARGQGIPVVADIESPVFPTAAEFLPQIDHLILGLAVAEKLTGQSCVADMVRALFAPPWALPSPPRRACVVTAGARGCWYSQEGGAVHHFPAFRVPVVDTTGCGDVFHGAYAAALAEGQSIPQAVAFASAAAGLKAAHPGSQAGAPDRSAVESFLHAQQE